MARLVLWDIDHTLIDTGGVGHELSGEAFREVTGQTMERQAKVDGITESVIFRETARLHGLTTDRSTFERFARALTEQHLKRAGDLRERGHALAGAATALDALAADTALTQSVVTGNVRAVAEIKLQVFGLDRHIRWDVGAYGEEHDERARLVALALERAGVPATDAVLIGDTPADVAAGNERGVRVLAVASGSSDEAQLRQAGADIVLPSLEDSHLLVKLVHGRDVET
ncbi:haloacid dehalogenase-like hydrolase [Streptomyces aculeolatus]|uniref:HAD family hydrolase n=1 Tax=Streptomyces aculeolatus TaxID=270689 RepID=UPI001CED74CF|nr:HAD hydrolase-like protein [Streptomyces aculeolatus]